MKSFIKVNFIAVFILLFAASINAQQFSTPRPSPVATVKQTVGVTDVTINYSRPGVKDRVIWGELVPYGEVWRTGANEVTAITFSDPVKIGGTELPAGTYGIHTIPGESEWEVMLSKDTKVGDGPQFNKDKEAVRIKVKPEQSDFTERMTFNFDNVTDNSAIVSLEWDKLRIPFMIETATQDLVLSKANNAVSWSVPMQAATYCLQNNVNMEQAMKWIDASVLIEENYWNMRIKAQMLAKAGKKDEAVAAMQKALEHGDKMENKPFDYDSMKNMLNEWKS